jgi:hypothetical protein
MSTIRGFALIGFAAALGGCTALHEHAVTQATSPSSDVGTEAAWNALDSNHDGVLSMDELVAQHAMGLIQDMPNVDRNDDGHVSRAEWNNWWPRMTRTTPSPTMARLNAEGPVSHLAK